MKTLIIAITALAIHCACGQEYNCYLGKNNEELRSITIDPVLAKKGMVSDQNQVKIATFEVAIRSWVFSPDGSQTFYDKDNKHLAQIKYEANKANLYNKSGKWVYTFALDPKRKAQTYLVALTRSDDIVFIDAKTCEVVDSYNFRILHIAQKAPHIQGFSTIGSYIRLYYDAKGKYLQTAALKIEPIASTPEPTPPSAPTPSNTPTEPENQQTSLGSITIYLASNP